MRNRRGVLAVVVLLIAATALAVAMTRGGHEERFGKGADPDRDVAGARIAAFHGTVKRVTAQAAATPTGFDSERLWSTGDDWEPAVAVDPRSGSSLVYQ